MKYSISIILPSLNEIKSLQKTLIILNKIKVNKELIIIYSNKISKKLVKKEIFFLKQNYKNLKYIS